MTIIARFAVTLLFLAGALPFVAAKNNCQSDEFWWPKKSCCLPNGGPGWNPPPPRGKKCPGNWWWNDDHNCCTPPTPIVPDPKCDNGWHWDDVNLCCEPNDPRPSGNSKRAPVKRDNHLCPMGHTACPIPSLSGLAADFECLDTTNELESCGGCASIGKGEDCTAITGAWNVACERGVCKVSNCAAGYKRSRDSKFCVPV